MGGEAGLAIPGLSRRQRWTAPHGRAMLPAWKDEFNTDLLAFLKN
jgi:hypothetical protein